jgi:hypothetical protein
MSSKASEQERVLEELGGRAAELRYGLDSKNPAVVSDVMEDKKYIFINIYLFVCLYMTVD